jgi:hypothetical protein
MMKRILITSLAAATISTLAIVAPTMFTPAAAQANFNLSIGAPAPAYYYEPVPAPQYVWAPGYYGYGHRYWVRDGYWEHRHWHHWNHWYR